MNQFKTGTRTNKGVGENLKDKTLNNLLANAILEIINVAETSNKNEYILNNENTEETHDEGTSVYDQLSFLKRVGTLSVRDYLNSHSVSSLLEEGLTNSEIADLFSLKLDVFEFICELQGIDLNVEALNSITFSFYI